MATGTTRAAEVMEGYWLEADKERTERLRYLRKACYPKHPLGGAFMKEVGLCTERLKWFTKVYKETDGLPWKIRRAMALATYIENMPIFIIDHSQLVGYDASKPNLFPMHHEVSHSVNDDLYYEPRDNFPGQDKAQVREMLDYWQDKTYEAIAKRYVSAEEYKAGKMGMGPLSAAWLEAMSSSNVPYQNVIEHGMGKLLENIEKKLKETETALNTGPGDPDKIHLMDRLDQYKAMLMAGRAWQNWVRRYSRLAKIIAENFETDPKRKEELLQMSERLTRNASEPPEHFHEALQLVVLIGIMAKTVERSHTGWGMLPDQLFWPFYEKDVKIDKTLTKQDVLELFAEWRIRIFELGKYQGRLYREIQQGMTDPRVINIGGVKADGTDACNELTELMCDAARIIRTSTPSLAFRYHPNASISALRAAFNCLRQGNGLPSFENNTTKIEQLMGNFGVPLKEARDWANVVCKSPGVTSDNSQAVRYAVMMILVTKTLEYTLYNGNDAAVTKMNFGPKTGEPEDLDTWEKFLEALQTQMNYMCDMISRIRNKCRWMEKQYMTQPFLSCIYLRCAELGVDAVEPYETGNPWYTTNTMGDLCESLYPIKKLVYEEKKYTLRQLVDALKANWEGYEEMRQEFANLPKWGNDIDEVDKTYTTGYDMLLSAYRRGRDLTGAPYLPLPNTNGTQPFITRMGALPYGRRFGEYHTDGGSSPVFGADKKGPTAVLKSCSKIDAPAFKGILLNQRLSPTQLQGEKGFQMWLAYMKTWHDLGVDHVQFNLVDNETLRAAQKEPEKYTELIVRVAGWSSHFVDLNRMVQDSIIARNVQEL